MTEVWGLFACFVFRCDLFIERRSTAPEVRKSGPSRSTAPEVREYCPTAVLTAKGPQPPKLRVFSSVVRSMVTSAAVDARCQEDIFAEI